MTFLSRLGIAKRLHAVTAVITVALVSVAALAFVRLNEVSLDANRAGDVRVPQLQRMAALELNVTRVSLQLRHAMLSRSPEELSHTLADVGAKRKLIDETIAEYEKALAASDGKERFAKVAPLLAKFWQIGEANIKLIQDGKKAEAFAFLVDKTIPARNALLEVLADTVKYQRDTLDKEIDEVEANAKTTLKALLGMIALVVVGLLLFSWHVASVLRRRVSQTQAVAERVRDGDLSAQVQDESHDEFSPLLAAMRDMQSSLTRVVGTVRNNADSVATASAQIAQGNQDLSQRTEEQASSLQQAAASMEELGSTVKQNADNASQADQLAKSASDVAVKGGEVVGEVVQTMKGINEASKKIADIIGTIDGIAFQTNILALNAAVEAARAGEQGRGFAVVAGEVRSLAQRSAEAAKEIKALISTSVERVEQGSVLADQAGVTMQEVVTSIRRVTDIMGEISEASREQSAGVAQVGESVTQMDQVTQQNAALVEESAAAAESLKQQAQQLVQAVAVFRLESSQRVPAAPVTPSFASKPAPIKAVQPAPRDPAPAEARAPAQALIARAASKPAATASAQSADNDWTTF